MNDNLFAVANCKKPQGVVYIKMLHVILKLNKNDKVKLESSRRSVIGFDTNTNNASNVTLLYTDIMESHYEGRLVYFTEE